ncbi:MAG: Mrp/NBP35 family ATP-binding protein [Lachnospiraceae bacterium]|nr:Mrp/NBP35 family ATP-binding protein [Lachnospiraceae bacterium]MDD3659839.1 Mrp/NBP35 family ATP-binding protein [Lachnospiraceae bacterium]
MTEERNQEGCGVSGCSKDSCEGCSSQGQSHTVPDFRVNQNSKSNVKKVVGIVSGKGGVGKSLVTGMLAVSMCGKDKKIGILDADITGPSIPKMFGIHDKAIADETGIIPLHTRNDMKVMSVNLLLEDEEAPVIWRGPVLANAVKQFWSDVNWGELDYLFIDMPPGTGDVPLTVFQSIPLDGIVIVTSPQDLVSMIVKKAYYMAMQMNIPVLGMIENMSYVKCPDCGKEINLFGESNLDEIAAETGLEILGRIPIDTAITGLINQERFEEFEGDFLQNAVEKIEKSLN